MGGLSRFLPFTYICFVFGSSAIVGFPFLTGFYSKDIILELLFSRYMLDGFFIHFLALLAAFFTSVYSIRLILLIFFGDVNFVSPIFSHVEDCGIEMFLSMFFLCIFSIFFGYLFSDLYIGAGSFF